MAKRSNQNQLDLTSETQQNARWFFGRRTHTAWMDMSEAEWSRHWRDRQSRHPLELILLIIYIVVCGIPLTIGSIMAARNGGFSTAFIVLGALAVLFWFWIIRYLRWFFRKD